jgi:D-alanyl-D-alanine carboxypeptidase
MLNELTLHNLQTLHVRLLSQLIAFVYSQGFELTWGEAFRTAQQAQWDAAAGTGIAQSVHCSRLAVDLQLFKEGTYLTNAEDYKFAGEYWKSLHPLCRWGGDFARVDADHFSLEYEGRA